MTRRILVAAALVALLAGCGGSGHQQAVTAPTTTQAKPKPEPKPKPKHRHRDKNQPAKLVVTILDGDRLVRVARPAAGWTDRYTSDDDGRIVSVERLEALRQRGWWVRATSARSGDGVEDAFRDLAARLG